MSSACLWEPASLSKDFRTRVDVRGGTAKGEESRKEDQGSVAGGELRKEC